MTKQSKKPLPPLKAIRKHCLDCVGNCCVEFRTCTGNEGVILSKGAEFAHLLK
jgi:hypothetical protein